MGDFVPSKDVSDWPQGPDGAFNPWGSALRMLSSAPAVLPDGGLIPDAGGWKVARLVDPREGIFRGLAYGTYGKLGYAVCAKDRRHFAPFSSCDCGFYAMKRRSNAVNLMERWRGFVLLRVELYGEMFDHRDGWRSSEQEIVGLYIPDRCGFGICREKSLGVGLRRGRWLAACGGHGSDSLVTFSELRSRLGVDVNHVSQ